MAKLKVKMKTTFDLNKLARNTDKFVVMGINKLMTMANISIEEHLTKQKDIHGKGYTPLSPTTGEMRIAKAGHYKKGGGGGILNYTGNMKKRKLIKAQPGANRVAKIEVTGKNKIGKIYGALHNSGGINEQGREVPQREWFGLTKDMQPGGKKHKQVMGLMMLAIRRSWKKGGR